ncbi:MAG: aldo/keto reductase [Myxococcota bacterium]
MQTRRIADITVSCIGLGGMPLSIQNRPDEEQGIRVIHAALDAGMTLIDTADVYCIDDDDLGHNERLIAKALSSWSGNPAGICVATKGGLERPKGDWTRNGKPAHLRRACERSLKALGVERIDVYQLHAPDPEVPLEESVGALAELQRQGKIRHVALSNVTVPEIERARKVCGIVSVQNRCNILERSSFASGVAAYCQRNEIAFLPHSPVGGHRGHVRLRAEPVIGVVAQRLGVTPYQVALAWLLAQGDVVIPIPGASREESARSSAAAAEVRLGDEDLRELNRAFPTTRA